MSTLAQLEQEAMKLTDTDRAKLAAQLLDSLPAVLSDEDEGVAEALRRDAELDASPEAGISLEELKRRFPQ